MDTPCPGPHHHIAPPAPRPLPLLPHPQREQADKESRQRDKQQAHLFCSLKVAGDADMAAQVGAGNSGYFDLVDHDK